MFARALPVRLQQRINAIRCTRLVVTVEHTLGLIVSGSTENLALWCSHFRFPATAQEGDHHHPEHKDKSGYISPNSLSVIIEVQGE
jgi:hypothetical protein